MSVWLRRWQRGTAFVQAFLARRWRRLLDWRGHWQPRDETIHLLLAAVVGILGALTNAVFFHATQLIKWLVLDSRDDALVIAESLPAWKRLAVPAAGGLVAGAILFWGQRLVKRRGSTNLLEVVVVGDGRLPFRPNLTKSLSSLMSVATGASIGREGPITQMAATLASKLGQWLHWPPYRLRLLVACGAAAGLAAAYNAPVAGAVFAAQIVLGNFSMNLFAPLVCASVIAAVVSRSFFGIEPWYHVPEFQFTRVLDLPWFIVLGGLSGALGAAFLRLLQLAEQGFAELPHNLIARLGLAGLIAGALSIWVPEVWGNGYSAASRILADDLRYGLVLLAVLLLAKLAATVATVGAGTVGGVFTPTIFLGAALGSLLGHALHDAGWAQVLPTGAFALVGMGSLLAATTHSPLLAMIMVFEISLNYSLMPAIMLACAVGTLVSRRLHPRSIYTEPLRQKGLLEDDESERLGAATEQTVGDLMREPVPPVRETATFRELGERFLTSSYNFLPVVDSQDRLSGLVALQDLKAYLNAGPEFQAVIAFDVMRPPPPCLTPNLRLHEALPILLASEQRNVPVVNTLAERRLVGALVRAEALSRLSEAIARKTTPGA